MLPMANILGRNTKSSKPAANVASTPRSLPHQQHGTESTGVSVPKKAKSKAEQRNQKGALIGIGVVVVGIILFLVLAGSGSSSPKPTNGTSSASTALANEPTLLTVVGFANSYSAQHGKTFPSTYVMRNELAKALPQADIVDANNFPKKSIKKNGQVSVLVSGGPLFAAGQYVSSANNGLGGCVYVASYAFGPGRWGFGLGEPGVPCGAVSHGQPSMNTVKWHKMTT